MSYYGFGQSEYDPEAQPAIPIPGTTARAPKPYPGVDYTMPAPATVTSGEPAPDPEPGPAPAPSGGGYPTYPAYPYPSSEPAPVERASMLGGAAGGFVLAALAIGVIWAAYDVYTKHR